MLRLDLQEAKVLNSWGLLTMDLKGFHVRAFMVNDPRHQNKYITIDATFVHIVWDSK